MRSKKVHNSKSKKKGSPQDSLGAVVNPGRELRFFNSERKAPAHLRRRLTLVGVATATAGSAFAYAEASGNVVNATEWAQLSPNYQQYRIRAIRVIMIPRNFNNMSFAATVWYPGSILTARYPTGSSASGTLAIWAEGGSKVHDCLTIVRMMATMQDNPDAALWTDCNATVSSLSQYGVQSLGTVGAPAIYNGVVTHDIFTEWDVEFLARN